MERREMWDEWRKGEKLEKRWMDGRKDTVKLKTDRLGGQREEEGRR